MLLNSMIFEWHAVYLHVSQANFSCLSQNPGQNRFQTGIFVVSMTEEFEYNC